jgi:GntR family transcriptional repressor for pyruvate dehydrogenase complex
MDNELAQDILSPVGRRTLREHVEEALTDLILRGTIGPGGRLPSEAKLSEMMGVSRVVIREAVRSLQARGLVKVMHGKGLAVGERGSVETRDTMSVLLKHEAETLAHLWEARVIVETGICRITSQRATDEQIEAMDEAAHDFAEAGSDVERRLESDERFHRLLAEATGNGILVLLRGTIGELLHSGLKVILSLPNIQPDADGHLEILAVLRDRDIEGASAAMQSHLERAKADLIQASGMDWESLCNQ